MPNQTAQCAGKIGFESAVLAREVARRRGNKRRRKELQRRPGSVYRCVHCGRWHIGTATLKPRQD